MSRTISLYFFPVAMSQPYRKRYSCDKNGGRVSNRLLLAHSGSGIYSGKGPGAQAIVGSMLASPNRSGGRATRWAGTILCRPDTLNGKLSSVFPAFPRDLLPCLLWPEISLRLSQVPG